MFHLDEFVSRLRAAAVQEDAAKQVRALMTEAFADPAAIGAAFEGHADEDEVLFEDDTVSIWFCAFDPSVHVPPHDHQTTATIGVFKGAEDNHFYLAGDGKLERKTTKRVSPGEVIAIGPDAIHSVETADENYSYAIHVYLAPLTRLERSLFDWDSGEAQLATDEAFAAMERASGAAA